MPIFFRHLFLLCGRKCIILSVAKNEIMEMKVVHHESDQQFVLLADGEKAYVSYEMLTDSLLDLQHTIVPKPISGRGIASLLVQAACDYARSKGYKIRATCAYAQVWLERHPGYDYEICGEGASCSL